MGEWWPEGSSEREVRLKMTDRVQEVEWIVSVIGQWSGSSVKEL